MMVCNASKPWEIISPTNSLPRVMFDRRHRLSPKSSLIILPGPLFWRSPETIETWIAEVQEAVSLPPLVIIPASQCLSCRTRQPHQRNSFFKISSPIPWDTFTSIRSQLAETNKDTLALLEQLPDPEFQPLVSTVITLTFTPLHY